MFEDLAKTPQLRDGVDRLFAGTTDVKLIATALQWALRSVELDARRWRQVREGGVALGNEAIIGVADERSRVRPEPVAKKPWWRFW